MGRKDVRASEAEGTGGTEWRDEGRTHGEAAWWGGRRPGEEGGAMFLKILQITRLSLTSVFNGSNTKLFWIVVIKKGKIFSNGFRRSSSEE